ncbi:serine/threonine protein kinase [Chromobacterium subtsugae]|uniref:Stress response kinase A n=1 Tax=Chromobacterium subtsugae TaxID=251747 RepID=A0ABS7FCC0_9NEIS|nr:serine/threonine protein kinase [Chromobacterium subtsugae]KZE85773.1 serine/threonine protein kinase [Chromobacterium sp. F49]MBW7566408.1 serine/threonine protein kinase [Chromobacterium subtsugae]MBW8287733.1 serine/threonine protein kinase [Chromobacterium subtsugae]OBU85559.1 serine/threonine protein kinase [Chromobacterium subtsugae]
MDTTLPPPFAALTPDAILDAVESLGLRASGSLLALNSYENRVYQVGIDDGAPLVAKFYRPQRWSDDAILEEHAFSWQLAEREIPAVPPLRLQGRTLHEHGGFRFALFERRGGRVPELDRDDTLQWIGRFLGRIHALGRVEDYRSRPTLDQQSFGREPADFLLQGGWLPPELGNVYRGVLEQALEGVARCFERAGQASQLRLHGDCHVGNLLWTDAGPHFVDFDDSRMGPAVQDLWMLLSGERAEQSRQLAEVLAGYEDFCEFDTRELYLLEGLRTLRLIHYSAWLARRWHDPAFPAAFPWFGGQRYWEEQILALREQIALMDEPPLWSC